MKLFNFLFCNLALCFSVVGNASAPSTVSDRLVFVKNMVTNIVQRLIDLANNDSITDKGAATLSIISDNCDIKFVADHIVGPALKTFSPIQKKQYYDCFQVIFNKSASIFLQKCKKAKFKVTQCKMKTNGDATVTVLLDTKTGPMTCAVVFHYNTTNNDYKAVDFIFNGISILAIQKEVLHSIWKQSGNDPAVFIQKLQSKHGV